MMRFRNVAQIGILSLGFLTLPMFAQQPDAGRPYGTNYPRTEDRGFDYGWLGLIGLFGLAGLRRPAEYRDRTGTTYQAHPSR